MRFILGPLLIALGIAMFWYIPWGGRYFAKHGWYGYFLSYATLAAFVTGLVILSGEHPAFP